MSVTVTTTAPKLLLEEADDSVQVANQQVMSWWLGVTNGIAVGTRRPTSYPEWVTIEVAQGGFATGRALAALTEGERASSTFLSKEGIEQLINMLTTGRYQIDQPENAALLVMVWLVIEGRQDEASALFAEIAPYLDELRFYPHPTAEPVAINTTTAAVHNIGKLRSELKQLIEAYSSPQGFRFERMRRQRAVAEGYAELQADAIDLLLTTVRDRDTFLEGQSDDLFSLPLNQEARDSILERAATLAQQYGVVASHQRSGTTTAMIIEYLQNPSITQNEKVATRIRAVAKARGLKGSAANDKYLARTRVSAIPDQQIPAKATAITQRLASLQRAAHLSSEASVLYPITQDEDAFVAATGRTEIPNVIVRAVRKAIEAPLERLIADDVIVSAEMIAQVLPQMLSAAVGESIEDPVARRLYSHLSVAFSHRRSLLLLNFEKQVRLEELPWARPLIALIKEDDSRQCEAVVNEAVRCHLKYFPATPTPNKLISALKDVMRKGTVQKANLMEELAADIFQNGFSPNFDAAALVAARMMRGTLYARYYGLDSLYENMETMRAAHDEELQKSQTANEQLPSAKPSKFAFIKSMFGWFKTSPPPLKIAPKTFLFTLATEKMKDWQRIHDGSSWNTVQNGQTIEAAMIITTHNLAQLVDLCCKNEERFDFREAAMSAWKSLVRLLLHPPKNTRHGSRDIAYSWRQILFYLSQLEASIQEEVCKEMKTIADRVVVDDSMCARLRDHFLLPLENVIKGGTHEIQGKVEKGAIVLGYFGWNPFSRRGNLDDVVS